MANIEFKDITDFIDIAAAENSEYVTKVRVSLDNGNTWGILFQAADSNIYLELDSVESIETWNTVKFIEIPYGEEASYYINYKVLTADGQCLEKSYIEHTFDYDDYLNKQGTNTLTFDIEYEGKAYQLTFNFEIRLQGHYYYRIEQDGDANIYFNPNTSESDVKTVSIPYTVKLYDSETGNILKIIKTGEVVSQEYCYQDVVEDLVYDESNHLITTIDEIHSIEIDGVNYEFEVTINLYNDDYVYIIRCHACGELYTSDNSACPICDGNGNVGDDDYGDDDYGDDDEYEYPIEVICSNCGSAYNYYGNNGCPGGCGS